MPTVVLLDARHIGQRPRKRTCVIYKKQNSRTTDVYTGGTVPPTTNESGFEFTTGPTGCVVAIERFVKSLTMQLWCSRL